MGESGWTVVLTVSQCVTAVFVGFLVGRSPTMATHRCSWTDLNISVFSLTPLIPSTVSPPHFFPLYRGIPAAWPRAFHVCHPVQTGSSHWEGRGHTLCHPGLFLNISPESNVGRRFWERATKTHKEMSNKFSTLAPHQLPPPPMSGARILKQIIP